MSDNAIVTLNPLSGLTSLASLDLADNLIENVSSLPSLSSLETLDLRNNSVTDVTPLSTMTDLDRLYLRGNEITVTNIKELVKLKEAGTTVDITLPRAVTIRDDNLAAALRSALNFQPDNPIFPEDMAGLTTFTASNQNIVNPHGS